MRSDTRQPYHEFRANPQTPREDHPYDPSLVGDTEMLNYAVDSDLEPQYTQASRVLDQIDLLPETKTAILASTILSEYLESFNERSTPEQYHAVIRQVAREMAAEKRRELEKAELRFDRDNTLILDQNGQAATEYPKLKAELQQLSQLTEAGHSQFEPASSTNVEQKWFGEPLKHETEQEQKQQLILYKLEAWPISPELKLSLLDHPAMAYNLLHTDLADLKNNAAEIIRNVAQEMAGDERVELENAGLNLDNEGALIHGEGLEQTVSPELSKRLKTFQDLLEVVHFKQLRKQETIHTPAEKLAKLLPAQLKRLGLSDHAINAAIDLHVVDEFISEGHLTTTVPAFREAAAKTLRHVENTAGFTLDEMSEPVVLGFIKNLKNFFTGGRVVEKLKSRREYAQMLALSALLEDLGGVRESLPINYPKAEQFAEQTPTARPSRVLDRPAARWAMAGASGLIGAAAVKEFADNLHHPTAHFDQTKVHVHEDITETSDTNPKITIAPRNEKYMTNPTLANASAEKVSGTQIPPRFYDQETRQTAQGPDLELAPKSITTKLSLEKSSKKVASQSKKSRLETATAAKKKVEKIVARNKAASMIPSTALESVLKKDFRKPVESKLATNPKPLKIDILADHSNQPDSLTEPIFADTDDVDTINLEQPPTTFNEKPNPYKTIEQTLAKHHLKALPDDVRTALKIVTPQAARKLLFERISSIHNDPKTSADRITALHLAHKALENI